GDPVVRIPDCESAERWQKEEVKADDADQRCKHCRPRAPGSCDKKNNEQKSQSDCSGIDPSTEGFQQAGRDSGAEESDEVTKPTLTRQVKRHSEPSLSQRD